MPAGEGITPLREIAEAADRNDEVPEHPRVVTPAVGSVLAKRGVEVQFGRRKETGITDQPFHEGTEGCLHVPERLPGYSVSTKRRANWTNR
ncbi:MAG: hypothetical protein R3E97_12795 [Candidatus Eisenbacteria bacterium]